MKRICDPSSGKLANTVYLIGRNGQVVRTRVIPANPNTAPQVLARAHFETASRGWDALTQEQQLAWIEAAAAFQSRSRLGMSGPLTGNQFFVKANANLLQAGAAMVDVPPSMPAWDPVDAISFLVEVDTGVASLVITAAAGGAWPTTTKLRASAPVNNGIHRAPGLVELGTVPAKVGVACDISTMYKARFGEVPLGKKVFIELSQTASGFDGPPVALNSVAVAAT